MDRSVRYLANISRMVADVARSPTGVDVRLMPALEKSGPGDRFVPAMAGREEQKQH